MDDSQLIDILLNRHMPERVCDMIMERSVQRFDASRIVEVLPPGIEQRTPAWYTARKGLLTASDFKVAGAENVSQAYVFSKVFPKPFVTNDAMTWGCRFEDLACQTYEFEHNTRVVEYGLLIHPTDTWLGASPDGITAYGVMIEIKCPFSRKRVEVDKRVSNDRPFAKGDRDNLYSRYVPQVQGQLEVCNLESCDFVVAHIDEMDEATFWQMRRVSESRHRYAVVIDVVKPGDEDGGVEYKTSPMRLDDAELHEWIDDIVAKSDVLKKFFVHLRELGVTRVDRDREMWARMRKNLSNTKAAIDEVVGQSDPETQRVDWGNSNPPMFSTEADEVAPRPSIKRRPKQVVKAAECLFSQEDE